MTENENEGEGRHPPDMIRHAQRDGKREMDARCIGRGRWVRFEGQARLETDG